ncbi:MAG: M1 family metallopeptidase [Anaerolineales bacterium]
MPRPIHRPMLLVLLIAVLACGSCRPAATADQDKTVSEVAPSPFDFDWDDRTAFNEGMIPSAQEVLGQLEGASVYHIDLLLADDLMAVGGQLQVRYTNQETEALEEVYFRLFPNIFGGSTVINSATVDGQEVAPVFELWDSAMGIPLPTELQPGQSVVIELGFAVVLPEDGGGNYNILAYTDGILALAHFYPVVAVYDDEGWNIEIPSEQGDVLYADTSFFIVRVTAPAELTLVASGFEIGRQTVGDLQQATYAAGPMRDFFLAASERFEVISGRVGDTTVNSYAPSEFAKASERVLRYATQALKDFDDRFGLYPFMEFDLVSTSTLALGIEYPGIVVIALRMYDPEVNEYPEAYLESTVAHEVAHQWFYSIVGNDQLDEPWVDEAVTQYATLLYYLDEYGVIGETGFRESLNGRWARVDYEEIPIGMPVAQYVGREYGAIVYGRGPLFFEALEEVMDQEDLEAFLRDYLETFRWGIATTESLKALAESHCDCDLTPLFLEWVYAP